MSSADETGSVEPTRPAAPARCSRHPEDVAEGTCVRCGDFLCEGCVESRVDDQLVCAPCAPHVRATAPLPWDDRTTPLSFGRTVARILLEPRSTFSRMAPEPMGRAYWFAALWWLLPALAGAVALIRFGVRDAGQAAASLTGLILAPLLRAGMITATLSGVVYGISRIFGGRGRYATDFRAVAYATPPYAIWEGITAWLPEAMAVFMVPLLGLGAAFSGWLLMQAAQSHHRLSTAQAAVAGYSPLALFILLVCGGMVVGAAATI